MDIAIDSAATTPEITEPEHVLVTEQIKLSNKNIALRLLTLLHLRMHGVTRIQTIERKMVKGPLSANYTAHGVSSNAAGVKVGIVRLNYFGSSWVTWQNLAAILMPNNGQEAKLEYLVINNKLLFPSKITAGDKTINVIADYEKLSSKLEKLV